MLFSTDMVRAILKGSKSQTRRLRNLERINENPDAWTFTGIFDDHFVFQRSWVEEVFIECPYGKPNDLMWVRESFLYAYNVYFYKADYKDGCSDVSYLLEDSKYSIPAIWKPSIHMPKRAARIWRKIVSTRVERLQSITEQDAVSEGIECDPTGLSLIQKNGENCEVMLYKNYSNVGFKYISPIESYQTLWEKINGPGNWKFNPWVWVVEFQ